MTSNNFCPPWRLDTESPTAIQTEQPCCERSPQDVTDVRQIPHHGDDEAFAERLQRAWQKMLDEGVDWFQAQGEQDRERQP